MVGIATVHDCTPYADEAEKSNPLLLAMAEQSMEKRQRRIASLLEALPGNLKAAEAAEAAAAAAAKAKQMELPSPEKVVCVQLAMQHHASPES
jgi:2-keto-4-pentenoate hydratase/2-oxohepta-3-ene-1,7-dioic acid hydratase in catechol pathway